MTLTISLSAVIIFIFFRISRESYLVILQQQNLSASTFPIPSRPRIFPPYPTGEYLLELLINFMILYPGVSDHLIYIVLISAFFFELISPRLIIGFFKERVNTGPQNRGRRKLNSRIITFLLLILTMLFIFNTGIFFRFPPTIHLRHLSSDLCSSPLLLSVFSLKRRECRE